MPPHLPPIIVIAHMGPENASREKNIIYDIFFIFMQKNVYRIRFQEIKIGSLEGFEKIEFFPLFLMRKRVSVVRSGF